MNNKSYKKIATQVALSIALVGSGLVSSQALADDHPDSRAAMNQELLHRDADNTVQNKRDARGDTLTPISQSNRKQDIQVTALIRKEVVDVPDFSTNAKNVKIITTADKKVTLRGPVLDLREAQQIVAIARRVAPTYDVVDQLRVMRDDDVNE